jgi:hypothetical protein
MGIETTNGFLFRHLYPRMNLPAGRRVRGQHEKHKDVKLGSP